jgi:hypothetical protein
MTGHSKHSGAFLVLGGEVCAGTDPTVVLLETADGQWDLLRVTDQLGDGWYQLYSDGITRVLHGPPRQHKRPARQHQRPALRRVRTPTIRGQRTVLAVYGRTT